MSSLRSFVMHSLLLGLVATALPACVSNDMRKFESTVSRPTTVRIVQAMTDGHVLWEKEIPVQHSLTVNLDREGEFEWFSVNPEKPATSFHWALFDDRGRRLEFGRESLPNLPVRIELAVRDAPEWPAGYVPPNQEPTVTPTLPPIQPPASNGAGAAEESTEG